MNAGVLVQRRLHNLGLRGTAGQTAQEVVRSLTAMQSQEYDLARWSVAQRLGDGGAGAVDQALAEGAILRTHVLRPTWHFVHRQDIRWLLAISAPRVNVLNAHHYRQLTLDDHLFARSNAVIAAAVDGGRHLTRTELASHLAAAGIPAAGQRLGYILMRAELDAVVCSGVRRGKQQTYASLAERAPDARHLAREAALAELTRRYFTSHGPATLRDFLWWSSLTAAEARQGLELLDGKLVQEVVDGRTYWHAGTAPAIAATTPVVDLVQAFDEYIVGYSESRDVLRRPEAATPGASEAMTLAHTILLDGYIAGQWRPRLTRRSIEVETTLDRPLDPLARQALAAAFGRYSHFAGLPVTWR